MNPAKLRSQDVNRRSPFHGCASADRRMCRVGPPPLVRRVSPVRLGGQKNLLKRRPDPLHSPRRADVRTVKAQGRPALVSCIPSANPQLLTTPMTTTSDPSTPAPPAVRRRGRPRKVDDAKRRKVYALVAVGCDLRQAARYAGCSYPTIRRETLRHPEFRERLRQALRNKAQIKTPPLEPPARPHGVRPPAKASYRTGQACADDR